MNARSLFLGRLLGAAVAGLAAMTTLPAQAGDVYWSVGVSSPGVGATVSNAPPVVYAPAPVVVVPAPVYTQPRVVHAPAPRVVYAPAPVYVVPGHPHKHKKHKHAYRHGYQQGYKDGHRHGERHGEWRHGHHGGPVAYAHPGRGWRD